MLRDKIKIHKKWLIMAGVAIIVAGAGIMWQNNSKKTSANPQKTISVERGDIATLVAATGSIQAVNSVDISSKITAQIQEVKVKENDHVTAGQVLVVLEDTGLQAQVTQAKERLSNAAVKYERNQKMKGIGAASSQQLDDAAMEYNIAQANYDQVMSSLNETIIKSPMDGIVIGKPLSSGAMVAQGVNNPTVIMTVADMSKMQIEVQVDQTDIGKLVLGQKANFTVDAYPDKTFTGVVSNISKKPVTQQNVIYYAVTVDINNSENLLNPGMVARVSIIASENKNVLTLPLSAIRTDKNGKYVVVMDEQGKTQNVPVTTGNMGEDKIEITGGVNEGDKIVVTQTQQGQSTGTNSNKSGGQNQNPVGGMMRRM